MSDAPEVAPPTPEVEAAAPVVSPEEMVSPAIRDGRRPWLRAGVVFGGSLAWSTAVFGAMVEHELWTGASAGFGLTLALSGVLSCFRFERATALRVANLGQLFRRGLVTLAVGAVLWMIFVFMTLVLCERSASGAMLVLGFLGHHHGLHGARAVLREDVASSGQSRRFVLFARSRGLPCSW